MGTVEPAFRRLGHNISRALGASGLSLDQVAEHAVMEKSELEKIIAGEDLDVTVEALLVLGGVLRAEPAALLEGVVSGA